jgi:hypothetical protein
MKYYHITKIDLITVILTNGLKANEEGEIFLFENKSLQHPETKVINTIADTIAKNQIFLEEYAMFEIDAKGINVELINDNVGEISSIFQWIVKQPVINKEHIILFDIYKTKYKVFQY